MLRKWHRLFTKGKIASRTGDTPSAKRAKNLLRRSTGIDRQIYAFFFKAKLDDHKYDICGKKQHTVLANNNNINNNNNNNNIIKKFNSTIIAVNLNYNVVTIVQL